jgi:N-acetylglucosamine-6-phosphate deacetylase
MWLHNARICPEYGSAFVGWLRIAEGRIAEIGPGMPATHGGVSHDLGGRWLLPGFVDVHMHGAVGHDAMDASVDGLLTIARFCAANGVTSFLPTTWTATRADMLAALFAIRTAMSVAQLQPGARFLGAHLEGPYLNAGYCGAQDARLIRLAERDETQAIFDTDVVRLVSLAPEFAPNLDFLDACVAHGIVVSHAHSAADYDQTCVAIRRGLCHATHTFNAMTGFAHRAPGAVGALLNADTVRCELIADGIHVHPAAMQLLWRAKGRDGIMLVTDAIRATGLPEGRYPLLDREIIVQDGSARLADGTLAGSVLTMPVALSNFARATGLGIEDIWPVSSLNAARQLGLDAELGAIATGKRADLVLLGDDYRVNATWVGGVQAFAAHL